MTRIMVQDNDSSAFAESLLYGNAPYASSLATLASISSQSVCSDSSSQASDDSSSTTSSSVSSSSDPDSCDAYYLQSTTSHRSDSCDQPLAFASPQWKQASVQAAPEAIAQPERRNSRRTGSGLTTRTGRPPTLVRQSDRKVNFVDSLVDTSTQLVETIWPLSSVPFRNELGSKGVLPLRTFIQETLRRSRTSYSTLQVALYYLILIKPHVPSHDFTMEQPDDAHAGRVLQCGRRMFLAALILASKYLQDRNFSARAWSKISGLNTQEINQNEIAFLIAVSWKLHVTDEIYQRWVEIVLKYTPHIQSSSGSSLQRPCDPLGLDWKQVVRKLNPELDNIEGLVPSKPKPMREVPPPSRSVLPLPHVDAMDVVSPIPRSHSTPLVMEPSLASVYNTTGRLAPALGLLPTPRLTPHSSGYSTPAVSAASLLLGKSSMGMAMAQASSVSTTQGLDRWPVSTTSSPCYMPARRSSLANSVSTASSPESMISDSSRTSRSSSISSASSLVSAPSTKLDIQARCRYARLCNERYARPTIIASVPEDYGEVCITSSPESYDGPVGKDAMCDYDDLSGATDAARTLQSLHNAYHRSLLTSTTSSPARAGCKRGRTNSFDNSLQDDVRQLLKDSGRVWSNGLVRAKSMNFDGSKRLCCSSEATQGYQRISSLHPVMGGPGGPGMWKGILDD